MGKIKREIITDGVEIYCGDALDIAPTIGIVDLIITDPPYLLTSGGGNGSHLGGCLAKGTYDNSGAIVACDISWKQISQLCFDKLKDGCHCYIMSNNRNLEEALRENKESGFGLHNILVWNKGSVTPNRYYMNGVEFCIFSYKNKSQHINDMSASNLFSIYNSKGNGHPTEKPQALMESWISQSSKIGELVFDPFMGSGTTGAACVALGRKFIGIELDAKYFDIACKRISEQARRPSLDFTHAPYLQENLI